MHVREDAQLLFGFIDRKERDVFRQLIKINGVGAKMALAMLSAMSAAELKMHVEQDSETALMRIPGIGKKTASVLLKHFRGIKAIRESTAEQLAEIVGPDKAQKVKAYFDTMVQ